MYATSLKQLIKQIYATRKNDLSKLMYKNKFDLEIRVRPDSTLGVQILSPWLILSDGASQHGYRALLGKTLDIWTICVTPCNTHPDETMEEIDWLYGSLIHLNGNTAHGLNGRLSTIMLAATLPTTVWKEIRQEEPTCITVQHRRFRDRDND